MKNRIAIILLLPFIWLCQSCSYFNFSKEENKTVIARVNKSYLYEEDISGLTTVNTSQEDSTLIVNNYIDRWATQQLLIDRAELNINLERQEKFDKLVKDYRNQLYTKAYSDAIVVKQLDSVVTDNQIEAYYESNKETFSLNEDIYKLRYIFTDENNPTLSETKRELSRFNAEDKTALTARLNDFKETDLNDSIWRESRKLKEALPVLKTASANQLQTADRYVQLKDSLGVYMVYIHDIKTRGEQAPLSFIKGTVKQIILSKRKQQLIKNLKKDITKDAIENQEFELYN